MVKGGGFVATPRFVERPAGVAVLVCAVVWQVCTAASAAAQGPALHRVTYIVTTDTTAAADIYYRQTDPPAWDEYSHNPYRFSPRAQVRVGPDTPWTLEVMIADPQRWAMVSATSGMDPATPGFRCRLDVDGVAVASGAGPKGAICAMRQW